MKVTKSTWLDVKSGSFSETLNALLDESKIPSNAFIVDVDYGTDLQVFGSGTKNSRTGVRVKFEWDGEE